MENDRKAPIDINKEEFQKIGHQLIDRIANFLDTINSQLVTAGETPIELQSLLGTGSLPENEVPPAELLLKTSDLLMNHSLLNGHPKFMGYITSSAAPIGILSDLLAATINPNLGAQILSPIATEIEKQTIKWLAEFIGVSSEYGGLLVSGGNMANFTAFLAARTAKAPKNVKEDGISNASKRLMVYCSKSTHTWVEKAAILFGLGTNSLQWIPTDSSHKMDITILEKKIKEDIEKGCKPLMIVGNAGDVSTGAVDNLKGIAAICKKYGIWFHVDGAYGIPAAIIPSLKSLFEGIKGADSIALDPHKWLYSPIEAGCVLIKNPQTLIDTFSSHPEYYNFNGSFDTPTHNYYEYGLQNSRGFRALKIWLALQQVGRKGYIEMIGKDIELSELLFSLCKSHPELEAVTQNLSITNLRYVPLKSSFNNSKSENYLNQLNEALLNELQRGGQVFLSNAIVNEKYCLRSCIVNFRTSRKDIEEIVEIILKEGRKMHQKLQVDLNSLQ